MLFRMFALYVKLCCVFGISRCVSINSLWCIEIDFSELIFCEVFWIIYLWVESVETFVCVPKYLYLGIAHTGHRRWPFTTEVKPGRDWLYLGIASSLHVDSQKNLRLKEGGHGLRSHDMLVF